MALWQSATGQKPDVEQGGPFDYDRLAPLEKIVEERWKYLHMSYHSVGYLLNPKYMDIDHTTELSTNEFHFQPVSPY
eukprot:COSAG02_NODE_46467_length_348_cov_1.365462_1_plen_77_part_00